MPNAVAVRVGFIALWVIWGCTCARGERPQYPGTTAGTIVDELHGTSVRDPYRWLENRHDPGVHAWLDAQRELTDQLLAQFAKEREQLHARFEQLFENSVTSTPVVRGDTLFYTQRRGLDALPTLMTRGVEPDSPVRTLISPGRGDAPPRAIAWWVVSPMGDRIAFGATNGANGGGLLHLLDVASATSLALTIPHTRSATVAWNSDGHGFVYTRFPMPGTVSPGAERYHRRVYVHEFGRDWQQDELLWGANAAPTDWPVVWTSVDGNWQFLSIEHDHSRNDLLARPAGTTELFTPVVVEEDALTTANAFGEHLYLRTSVGADRYRIVRVVPGQTASEHWQEIIPEQKGVIADFALANGQLVVHVLENALSRVLIHDLEGALLKEIELPALGAVSELQASPEHPAVYFRFESFASPPVILHYDLRAHTTKPFDQPELNGSMGEYTTRQVWCNSDDGTRVPVFLTHKRDLPANGDYPIVLSAYGAFGVSNTPAFRPEIIPFLNRGGIWAVANVRGGGEFGRSWQMQGRLLNKQNSVTDLLAVAQMLVAEGHTTREKLALYGQDAGALLVGAAITQDPTICGAAVCAEPLLDLLRFSRSPDGAYLQREFGAPADAEQCAALLAYSPLQRVADDVDYPALLLTGALNGDAEGAIHAGKFAARLQAVAATDGPVLLRVTRPKADVEQFTLRDELALHADTWTFLMWQLGLVAPAPTTAPATQPADEAPPSP